MIIGRVIGNVWATRKEDSLNGHKLLVIKPVDFYSNTEYMTFVAVDKIGAGIGDKVLVVQGSSARKATDKIEAPVDAAIIGIIDEVEVDKEL